MSSPCGKCNTCPCSQKMSRQDQQQQQQQAQQQQPQQYNYQQQSYQPQAQPPCQACSPAMTQQVPPSSYGPQQQQQQAYQQPGQQAASSRQPKIECLCTSNRQRNSAAVQAPLADIYVCSRPRDAKPAQVPMEERCTCKAKAAPATCECAAPVPPQSYGRQPEVLPPTTAFVSCGQPTHTRSAPPMYNTQQNRPRCGHCASQKKKCVIQ